MNSARDGRCWRQPVGTVAGALGRLAGCVSELSADATPPTDIGRRDAGDGSDGTEDDRRATGNAHHGNDDDADTTKAT